MYRTLRELLSFEINESNLPIRSGQIRARLQNYMRMVAVRCAVTLLVPGLMWSVVSHRVMLGWIGVLFLVYALESLYVWRYWHATRTVAECVAWRNRLLLFVSMVGGLWGLGGILFFAPGDLAHQAMLICAVLGMAAGSATSNPVFPPALYIFVSMLIVPLLLANALVGDIEHLLLAGMLLLFMLYVLNAGQTLARTYELSLLQMLENEQLVQRLTAENQRAEQAQRQAELANISKSKFLAAASHDLRQPMHALTMFVEALKTHVHGEQGTELMGQVWTSVEVLGEMLDALLDISRLDAGAVAPQWHSFNLQQVYDRIETEFCWAARQKGLELYMEKCATTVYSDPILLERILRNLLANAIRYTERGEVAVRSNVGPDGLQIAVRDCGIGIAEQHLPNIFDEYYQIGNTQRDRNNGLGLGLSIVHRLSRLLGCQVQVSSTLGVGSCFSLTVPIKRPDGMIGAITNA